MTHAAEGFKSYRYAGQYGFILIGANSHKEALSEAQRSMNGEPSIEHLQLWNEWLFMPVPYLIRREIQRLGSDKRMLENRPLTVNIRPEQDAIDAQIRELEKL